MGGEKFHSLKDACVHLRRVSIIQEAASGPVVSLASVGLHAVLPVMMLVGTWLVLTGEVTAQRLIVFLIGGMRICDPLLACLVYLMDMLYHFISINRIKAVVAEKPLPCSGKDVSCSGYDICLEHVNFSYGNNQVLFDVSCKMKNGKLTALVGVSGSGKSTLIRLIARFWDVDGGSISIGGVCIKDFDMERLASYFSIVFQDVYLFQDTIANNIAIGRANATREEIEEVAKAACLHEFIMKLPDKYDTMVGEGGNMLSGGEKQRVSIARAILKDAPIILLDEAASSLDAENEVLLQESLSHLAMRKTVIVIAHRLQSVVNADCIIVLKEGKVVEEGRHNDLMQLGGVYAHMWNEQQTAKSWKFVDREVEHK
jgi:ATP-binding cassette subfamily B protein